MDSLNIKDYNKPENEIKIYNNIDEVESLLFYGDFSIIKELDAEFILFNHNRIVDAINNAIACNDYLRKEALSLIDKKLEKLDVKDNIFNIL